MTRNEAASIIRWMRRERDKFRSYQNHSVIPQGEVRLQHFGDAYDRVAKELSFTLAVTLVNHNT